MSLLTCNQFLNELSEYLDDEARGAVRDELEQHVSECPNCWVIVDTTKKTIAIYKGMEAEPIPDALRGRLMDALSRRTGRTPDA